MSRSASRAGTAAVVYTLLAASLLLASLSARNPTLQTSPPNSSTRQDPPVQRPPVFRGGANFVLVDAYPHRDGRIVEGLIAGDFQVFEDGKPQAIETFEFVRVEPSLSESTRRDPNTQREAEMLAADPHNRVFVVFLDALHTTVEGSHNIRGPLVDALNRIVGPSDLFGVMTQNIQPRHLVLGRRLLGVEEQLTRHWPWGERHRITSDRNDPVEDYLRDCFPCKPLPNGQCVEWWVSDGAVKRLIPEVLIDRRREDRTLTSLEDLVTYLAGLREARTIVMVVSDGWLLYEPNEGLAEEAGAIPAKVQGLIINGSGRMSVAGLDGTEDRASCNNELMRLARLDNARRLRELFREANRSNVSFYPVTPAGLGVFDVPISQRQLPSGSGSLLIQNMDRVRQRVEGLRTLAENTDGIAIVNTNDLTAGLRRIVDDVSAYYLLGYYSTNLKMDGRLRKIEVKVKPPGLTVRARRGYVAPNEAALRASASATKSAASAPALVDDALGTLARLRPSSELFIYGTPDSTGVSVVVEIAAAQMASGRWNSGGEVQVVVTSQSGDTVGTAQGRIEPGARGTLMRVPLAAPVGGALRVAAKVGTGSVSLEDRGEIRQAAGRVLGEPLLFRGTPAATSALRAVADFQYRRTERAHIEWPILAPLDRRDARLLGRNGQPLTVPVTVTERESNGRAVLAADVNLAPLTEGDYVIEITVGSGAETEQKRVAIRVKT